LEEKINNPKDKTTERINKLKRSFPVAEDAKQKFSKASDSDKKVILSQLGSNLSLKDNELFN